SSKLFFFSSRRRHTRWPRDWSSDVCSSDLVHGVLDQIHLDLKMPGIDGVWAFRRAGTINGHLAQILRGRRVEKVEHAFVNWRAQIGRASCRERVEISVVAG